MSVSSVLSYLLFVSSFRVSGILWISDNSCDKELSVPWWNLSILSLMEGDLDKQVHWEALMLVSLELFFGLVRFLREIYSNIVQKAMNSPARILLEWGRSFHPIFILASYLSTSSFWGARCCQFLSFLRILLCNLDWFSAFPIAFLCLAFLGLLDELSHLISN